MKTYIKDKLIGEEVRTDPQSRKKIEYLTYMVTECSGIRRLDDLLLLVQDKIQDKWGLEEKNIYSAHAEENEDGTRVYVYVLAVDWEISRHMRYMEREKIFREDPNQLSETERDIHEEIAEKVKHGEEMDARKLTYYLTKMDEKKAPKILKAGLPPEYLENLLKEENGK